MDIPPPDPKTMLSRWMEWEKGELPPGELIKHLKIAGLRTLLEDLTAAAASDEPATGETIGDLLG